MSNKPQGVILLSPDQLSELIADANRPLVERLDAIEKKQLQAKLLYDTEEIATIVSVSSRTVRLWTQQGKVDRNGRLHILSSFEMVKGRYVFELNKVMEFINHFR